MYTQDRKAGSGGKPRECEKRALIERDAAFAAHLLPSTHLPTSRSPAAELDPPPSSSRRSPPLIGPMSPAR
ncbi:hypothetical protein HBI25_055130 [Parastagonospora nodorum]|nr:hypothetical protein HBH53_185300 [Parastagonospora nodorum]KAH4057859.1 hypothetical protein HBH50_235900 [Parastagonospora nodorum]KAH4079294.1 hypothetical protein HBH48_221860 [Parastagonospora nodorum]KAH4176584.1 hypothetical protein HBH43_060820 [Parastagonospora nodorum]KAH4220218.1 hypothetical protein HBI06_173260 [Parastagonospora nodorum]